jgi:hypothetical protein
MRRLALSVFTACGLALLSACSGGTGFGSGSSTQISAIVFTNGSAAVNAFFVAPGGIAPVAVDAVGTVSGGTLVYGQTFTWTARFVNPKTDPPSIATYTTGVAPATFKTCAAPPAVQPAVPLLEPGATTGSAGGYVGYKLLTAGFPVSGVYVGAVPGVTAPYCLVLTAFHASDGTTGTVTVVVSANP